MLLVELGALRQICDAIEIVQFEQIRSAFCSRSYDLRSDDLGEAPTRKEFSKRFQDCRLYLKDLAYEVIPQC
jgi:hypothetical protein